MLMPAAAADVLSTYLTLSVVACCRIPVPAPAAAAAAAHLRANTCRKKRHCFEVITRKTASKPTDAKCFPTAAFTDAKDEWLLLNMR
jgi:hypothetical protein